MATLATETWTGTTGAAWPSQWTTSGTGAARSIQANRGRLTTAASAYATSRAQLTSLSTASVELTYTVAVPPTAGTEWYTNTMVRASGVGGSEFEPLAGYMLTVQFDGGVRLNRYPGDTTSTTLGTSTFAGTTAAWAVRVKAVAGRIQARVWAAASAEPSTWDIDATDATPLGAGTVGIAMVNGGDAVARSIDLDDLTVTDGQAVAGTPGQVTPVGSAIVAGTGTAQTSLAVTLPTGLQVGDLLVAAVGGSASPVPAVPSGWTAWEAGLNYGPTLVSFYRVVDGTEAATQTWTVASGRWTAVLAAYRGVDTAVLKDTTSSTAVSTTAWPTEPSITTTGANAYVIAIGSGLDALIGTNDAGWTTDGTIDVKATWAGSSATLTSPVNAISGRTVTTPGTFTPAMDPVDGATRGGVIVSALRPLAVTTVPVNLPGVTARTTTAAPAGVLTTRRVITLSGVTARSTAVASAGAVTTAAGALTLPGVTARSTSVAQAGSVSASVAGWSAAWNAALASRATRPVNAIFIGDSLTEGQGASLRANRWQDVLRGHLRNDLPTTGVTGGYGYQPAWYAVNPPDSPWATSHVTITGTYDLMTWDGGNSVARRHLRLYAGSTASYTVTGTSVDFWYIGGWWGSAQVQVDGGTAITIDGSAGVGGQAYTRRITLGAAGAHTIKVTAVSDFAVGGLTIFNGDENAGIRLYDNGHVGLFTDSYLGMKDVWALIQPNLAVIELGPNDCINATSTPAQAKANILALIADVRSMTTGTVSVAVAVADGTYLQGMGWAAYRSAIISITTDDPTIGLIDYGFLSNTASDGVHPNNTGQLQIESAVRTAITPAGSLTSPAVVTGVRAASTVRAPAGTFSLPSPKVLAGVKAATLVRAPVGSVASINRAVSLTGVPGQALLESPPGSVVALRPTAVAMAGVTARLSSFAGAGYVTPDINARTSFDASGFSITIYNRAYQPLGRIADYISAQVSWEWLAAGTGEIIVGAEHWAVPVAMACNTWVVPVVIEVNGVRWTGRVGSVTREHAADGTGTATLSLVDDWAWLQSILAWPVPTGTIVAQTNAQATMTGPLATIGCQLINDNATRLGSPVVAIAPITDTSPTTTIAARFAPLADYLAPPFKQAYWSLNIAMWLPGDPQPIGYAPITGNLTRLPPTLDAPTVVIVAAPCTPKPWVRWSDTIGGVISDQVSVNDPKGFRLVLGGAGSDTNRVFGSYVSTSLGNLLGSYALPEVFADVGDLATTTDVQLQGPIKMVDYLGTVSVQVTVQDGVPWRFGTDYVVGDMPNVELSGLAMVSKPVTSVVAKDDAEGGLVFTPTIGDSNVVASSDAMIVGVVQRIAAQLRQMQTGK